MTPTEKDLLRTAQIKILNECRLTNLVGKTEEQIIELETRRKQALQMIKELRK